MFKKIIFSLLAIFIFFSNNKVLAFKADTFVTISNPVRGMEGWKLPNQDPLTLPKFQYQESTPSAYPITWMLRYDAISSSTISSYFNSLTQVDDKQSLGAFLEITPKLAELASVDYPQGFSIFNANRIFLSGYTQEDRIKLIDAYMAEFFQVFGFYPKSVAAWHLDSFSLEYLQTKYAVLTAMNCDDQYGTDQYRLWGGYLGSPYFPDKNNSLIPADSKKNRIDLAMVRWAQRDLFNFYGPKESSLFSVQLNDYLSIDKEHTYFKSLLTQYTQKDFNEFTYLNIGLENDYDITTPGYKDELRNIYQTIYENRDKHNLRPISLADFGDWLKIRYPESSPAYFYRATNPENPAEEIIWYMSPRYRIGIKTQEGQSKIIDFRVYDRNIYEEYYLTPNIDTSLYTEIPAIIDSVKYPNSELKINTNLSWFKTTYDKQWDYWQVSLKSGDQTITFYPDSIEFINVTAPKIDSKQVKVISKKNQVKWQFSSSKSYSWINLLLISSGLFIFYLLKKNGKIKINPPKKIIILGLSLSLLVSLTLFRNGNFRPFGQAFYGPNGHDAIFHLSLIEKFSQNPFNLDHSQIAGEKLTNYHLIYDYLSGVFSRILGISSLDWYFRFSPLIFSVAISVLIYQLSKFFKLNQRATIITYIFAFLGGSAGFIPKLINHQNIFSGESAFWANQSASIYLNPPFALSLIILLGVIVLLNKKETSKKDFILLIILGGLLAQTKIYAFILLELALLINKRFKPFLYIGLIGTFLTLPFMSFGGGSPFLLSPIWFPRSLFASFDRFYWPQFAQAWQNYESAGNFPKLLAVNIFAVTIFLIGNLWIRVVGLYTLFSKDVTSTRKIISTIIFLGIIIPLVVIQNQNPWNTIQFMYYSIFFLAFFTGESLDILLNKIKSVSIQYLLLTLIILLGVFTSYGTLKDYLGQTSASRVSFTESKALETLRQQPKGLVLTPMFSPKVSLPTPKSLYGYTSTAYVSALSGQPEYLTDTINLEITGFDYTIKSRMSQRFFQTTNKDWALNFLKTENISYVYETPLSEIKLSPEDLCLNKIFDSGEINIYKFNCHD